VSQTRAQLFLKPQREASVLRRHPWVFSGSVARVEGTPSGGDLVGVFSAQGRFLAWGHFSPNSQIRVRLVSWVEDPVPEGPDFWRARIKTSVQLRNDVLVGGDTTACRLVNAESDGVPGLIVDRYADTVVVQYLTAGTDARRPLFADVLWDLLEPRTLYERSDVDVREREGLHGESGLLRGTPPPERITISEHGLIFAVDVRHGHKTGFYLDQRDNRQSLREALARRAMANTSSRLLNVFAYTGGFAVYGLAAGAGAVTNVDTSADSLALGRDNLALNKLPVTQAEDITGDAFDVMRRLRDAGQRYDLVVLDPPKFASTQRDVQRAARGYKDINMQAIHLLVPGGLLFTFSCSGAVSDDLFQKIVFGAALDTGRSVQIVRRMMQASDHPVALTFPEGAYLKGLVCRVVD